MTMPGITHWTVRAFPRVGLLLLFLCGNSSTARSQEVLGETTWGGAGSDVTRAVAVSGTSTYLVGVTQSFGDPGALQIFAVRFGGDGSVTWQRTWDGPDPFFSDNATGAAAASDGSLYVAGSTLGTAGDALLLKFDAAGSLLWQLTWGTSTNDFGQSVAVATDGSVYLVGSTRSSDPGVSDLFVAKFSPEGALLWQKTWGTAGATEEAQGVAVAPDGSVIVVGYTPRTDGSFGTDIAVLKLDPDGNLLWQRTYGAGEGVDARGGVAVAGDGSIYVSGGIFDPRTSDLNVLLVKFSSDGALVWDREWGGRSGDSVLDVSAAPDGTILLSGQTNSFGAGSDDAFVLRLEPGGRVIHASTWGSSGIDAGAGVEALDATTLSLGATTETGPPYTFERAPSKTSRVRRSVVTTTAIPLLDATGTIADAGGTVSTPAGSTTYAGDFEAAFVRIGVPAASSFVVDTESAIGVGDEPAALEGVASSVHGSLVVRRSDATARLVLAAPEGVTEGASVAVLDVRGRRVRELEASVKSPGALETEWDLKEEGGRRVVPGLYFVRAPGAPASAARRIVVLD